MTCWTAVPAPTSFGAAAATTRSGVASEMTCWSAGAGADRLDGGEHEGVDGDFADYWESDAGVTVNLATGTASGGHAGGRHAHRH